MNRDLINVLFRTRTLFPHMDELAAGDQNQVQVADRLVAVTYGAGSTRRILYEVQFIPLMAMSRVLKKGLMTLADIENVQGLQTGDFSKRFTHGNFVKLLSR